MDGVRLSNEETRYDKGAGWQHGNGLGSGVKVRGNKKNTIKMQRANIYDDVDEEGQLRNKVVCGVLLRATVDSNVRLCFYIYMVNVG